MRHRDEAVRSAKARTKIALECGHSDPHPNDARPKNVSRPGGDYRYRIPTIGLNPGAVPGSSPHQRT